MGGGGACMSIQVCWGGGGGVLRQTDARNQPNRRAGLIEISNFTECEEPWTTEVGDLAYHEGFVL